MAAYARGRVAFMIRAQAMPAAAATAKKAGKIQASAEPGATPRSVAYSRGAANGRSRPGNGLWPVGHPWQMAAASSGAA